MVRKTMLPLTPVHRITESTRPIAMGMMVPQNTQIKLFHRDDHIKGSANRRV